MGQVGNGKIIFGNFPNKKKIKVKKLGTYFCENGEANRKNLRKEVGNKL